jgi:hypothetical protein
LSFKTDFKDFVAEDHPFPYHELFLLQPRPAELTTVLSSLDGNDFSSIHSTTQQLFCQGVKALESGDESKLDNVLVVLWFAVDKLMKDTTDISERIIRKAIP